MTLFRKSLCAALMMTAGFISVNASAGVVIGGTRVVYDGGKKEASLSVTNPDNIAYLIQSWVDMPEGGTEKAPFIITPPLYRLDHGQQNVMRIVRAGNLAEDKESLFWLNVKSIPSAKKADNTLQIAVKTRIKLIYRPSALKGTAPEDLANKLRWQQSANQVQVTNPTAYYMNFNEISVGGKKLPDVTYVAPGATAHFSLPAGAGAGPLTFKLISDYGGVGPSHQAAL